METPAQISTPSMIMNERLVDLRSDTFTLPTPAMYEALPRAELGDDMYGEDATVRTLESRAADLTGKEAGLLVSSGTQGNLVSLMAHGGRGDEVLLGRRSDLFNWEAGGVSCVAGLLPRPLMDDRGWIAPEDVNDAVRPRDIHFGRTRILAIENTHQWSGGTPIPVSVLEQYADIGRTRSMRLHMDGARLFNAAVAQGLPVHSIARHVDSVTFCLSKGLSCPVGSIVCGTADFIAKARQVRKMIGGAMRQAGWIAAPGLVALDQEIARLDADHRRAKRLAEGLSRIGGIKIDPATTQTNIVRLSVGEPLPVVNQLTAALAERGIKCFGLSPGSIRMVVHRMIDDQDIDYVITVVTEIARRGTDSADPPQ